MARIWQLICPRLSIRGDRAHYGTYRHRDIYLAEQLLLLTIRDDLGDLLQVSHLDR